MKFFSMGIKRKIFFGFIIIGFILFLSGLICIAQLVKIEKSASGMLSDNVLSIELSNKLMEKAEKHSFDIFRAIIDNDTESYFDSAGFAELISSIKANITVPGETEIADSLEKNYEIFKLNAMIQADLSASDDVAGKLSRFNNFYNPSFAAFAKSIIAIRDINHDAVSVNAARLSGNFYRMVMPLIIAMCVGLILIVLFNYFINLYFINPVLSILTGIKQNLYYKTLYNVKVDTKDEISELNENIKVMVSRSKKRETDGVFNLNNP